MKLVSFHVMFINLVNMLAHGMVLSGCQVLSHILYFCVEQRCRYLGYWLLGWWDAARWPTFSRKVRYRSAKQNSEVCW